MNKSALALSVVSVIVCSNLISPVKAKAYDDVNLTEDTDDSKGNDRTAGLLSIYYISVSSSSGAIKLSGYSYSNSTMSSIGFKNISIQRSSNGTYWTEEKTISDKLRSNSRYHQLSDYSISVQGGYYYRIVCDHYADNGSGTTQSVSSTSNSVWIN